MQHKHSKLEVQKFLNSVSIMSIAAIGSKGPISSVVLFIADDNLNLHFVARRQSFKSQALLLDNRISFSVWQINSKLIQGAGHAIEIKEETEINQIFTNLADSGSKIKDLWPPVVTIAGDEYIVFKVKPNWLRLLSLENMSIQTENPPFEEVELA